ncbi:hypothetical protein [Candidatus Azobacteroides pseudotrichonymphae]|uniref:Uncharacterized protein n=1 Tax=Azobacteroides pseudotrichonymphae genomovar. CFP2 TaxID=511995 RepID=B6YRY3_AZOPC|nr:hypothetical protein [Candidatus Azobacteroides pseudotrichonymphae]BAG83955.1 hypothetical protein CFPG_692 [Candidatus Azobacteroides pseudotrichonymphae genomovar. CFP2]BAG83969.1 hypothetical protein CFPG_706 [Candidatus Azobacteroides pseudotrichonymphae genomovar. CFP2]
MRNLAKVFIISLFEIILFLFPIAVHAEKYGVKGINLKGKQQGRSKKITAEVCLLERKSNTGIVPSDELYEEKSVAKNLKAYEGIPVPDPLVESIPGLTVPAVVEIYSHEDKLCSKFFRCGIDISFQAGDSIYVSLDGDDIYVYRKGQTEENLIEQESVKEEIEDVKPIDTPGVEEETEVLSEITEPDAAELCLLRKKEQIMKEVSDITLQWEQLISDENQYISELTILMGDLEESIGKMGSGKITCWNKELETINSRIGILNTKNGNIRYRRDKLKEKQTLIDSQLEGNPLLKEMVSMEYFFRLINEWNDLLKEANSKINTYNNIIAAFNSSVNHLNPSDNP